MTLVRQIPKTKQTSIRVAAPRLTRALSGLETMSHTLQELEDLIPVDPLNDSLRVELEQLLASSEPNEIEHELLYREPVSYTHLTLPTKRIV